METDISYILKFIADSYDFEYYFDDDLKRWTIYKDEGGAELFWSSDESVDDLMSAIKEFHMEIGSNKTGSFL